MRTCFALQLFRQQNCCTVAGNPVYQKYVDIQKKFARYLAHKSNIGINDLPIFNIDLCNRLEFQNDLIFLHKSLHHNLDSELFQENFVFSSSKRETWNPRAFESTIVTSNLELNGFYYRTMPSSNNLELKLEDLYNPTIESFKN
jgi:hypothetical protein